MICFNNFFTIALVIQIQRNQNEKKDNVDSSGFSGFKSVGMRLKRK